MESKTTEGWAGGGGHKRTGLAGALGRGQREGGKRITAEATLELRLREEQGGACWPGSVATASFPQWAAQKPSGK